MFVTIRRRLISRSWRRAVITCRGVASTPQFIDSTEAILHRSTQQGAVEETQDIAIMDRLLTTFRKRTDPSYRYRNVVPVRSKGLWSQALNQVAPPEGPSDNARTGQGKPDLAPRRMQDSYCEFMLPFASSAGFLESHTNAGGGIRIGMLMEHLDSLAGGIAYKHMLGPDEPALPQNAGFYIVTASVDRLDMLAPLHPVRDMRLSGQVIHTGKSSMEIAVRIEAFADGQTETVMLGRFCMVVRDAHTNRSTQVNPLILETPEDRELFGLGEMHKARRQSRVVRGLDRVPPTPSEAEALHSLYLKSLSMKHKQGDDTYQEMIPMGDTRLEKTMVMFPQERNVHRKIFGGYLMRLAHELGFANSCLFTRGNVTFLSLDGISFARPVPIGSLLRLTSNIVHSTSSEQYPALVHVWVHADVVNLETGAEQRTNDFRFTWCRETGPPLQRIVVPKTYKESMHWVEGRRALEMGAEIRKFGKRT